MPNYKETPLAGTSYTRCNQVLIHNPLGAPPRIKFDEQAVISSNSGNVVTGAGSIDLVFDPAKTIALLNPATNQPTGTSMTYAAVYAILYSAYIQAALERDAAIPPATPNITE
jgi:hypothetical protein